MNYCVFAKLYDCFYYNDYFEVKTTGKIKYFVSMYIKGAVNQNSFQKRNNPKGRLKSGIL